MAQSIKRKVRRRDRSRECGRVVEAGLRAPIEGEDPHDLHHFWRVDFRDPLPDQDEGRDVYLRTDDGDYASHVITSPRLPDRDHVLLAPDHELPGFLARFF